MISYGNAKLGFLFLTLFFFTALAQVSRYA